MKKNLLVLFIVTISALSGFCQNPISQNNKFEKRTIKPIARQILFAQSANEKFTNCSLFNKIDDDSLYRPLKLNVDSFAILSVHKNELKNLLSSRPKFLRLSIPNYHGQPIEVLLKEHTITTSDFSVKTSSGETIPANGINGLHYWGIINNQPNSIVAVSIFENDFMGIISTDFGNMVVGKLKEGEKYIIYNDVSLKGKNNFLCGNENDDNEIQKKATNNFKLQQISTTNCVRLYWEINYDIFLDKGSIANTTNFAMGIFNITQTLYQNDGIDVSLSQLYIWNTASPYTGTTTGVLLSQFQSNVSSFNGDLGHLIGYQANGGLAATILGLCSVNWDDKKCYSGIYSSYNNLPAYSWTIEVVTHEQGHLMGSRHTHACVWNGNNTAIDGCGPAAGFPYEGSCSGAPVPSFGTIMSYCHLATAIDFNLGFGPQPAAVIVNAINSAPCLSSCSPCTTPSNDNCNGATLLPDNTNCLYTNGTVDCATDDGFPTLPSCNGTSSTQWGVFYYFVAQSNNVTIQVNPTTTTLSGLDAVVVLYSGTNCFNLTEVSGGCVDANAEGVSETLYVTGLTQGQTYWIRIYDWGSIQPPVGNGGFQVCVTHTGGCIASTPSSCSTSIGIPANGLEHHTNLSCSSVSGVDGYSYDYSFDGISWVVNWFQTTLNSLDINNQDAPNVPYYYRVRTYCGTTYSNYINASPLPIYTACDDPATPTLNGATLNSLDVTLNSELPVPNPNITTYAIFCTTTNQYVQSNGSLGASAYYQTKSSWGTKTVTGLSSNSNYCFYAMAKNAQGDVRFNSANSACATTSNCSPPTNANASANPNPACVGNTVNLNASASGTVTSWSWSGPAFSSSSQNSAVNNIQLNQAGTYTVTASNSCGSTSSSVTITVNNCTSSATQPIAAGQQHSLAICMDGTARDWGWNGYGQLGDGSNNDSYVPIQVSGLTNLIAISGGQNHSLALESSGIVWAWGWNNMGQLGNNSTNDSNSPVQVFGLTGVIAIAGGGYAHSIALKSNGTVWAWGVNSSGQLGNGTTNNSLTAIQVSGLTGIIAISAGGEFNLALASNGTVWAWGNNLSGQLGNGTNTTSLVPVQVSGLTGVISIAAGASHSLALKSNGTVWAWGQNNLGQLGDGTNSDKTTPVQVSGLAGVIRIAAGYFHSIALNSNYTVSTWGYNFRGQLGNNSTTDSNTPVQVLNLTNVTFIAGGWDHTLALKSDETLWAWGYNWPGQLGNGTTTDSHIPVQVINLCPVALSVENSIDNSNELNIYPNPTYDLINITGKGYTNGRYELTLLNMLGQQLKKQSLKVSNHSIEARMNIKELSNGIYFLMISSNSSKQTFKIQKL